MPKYKYTFTNITIVGYLLIDTIFKILITYIFVLLTILLSFFIKKSYLLFSTVVIVIVCLLNQIDYTFIFPIALIQTNLIFETGDLITLFGIIFDTFLLQIVYLIFFLIIFSWIITIVYKKYKIVYD